MGRKLSIVFMGTPDFAVAQLDAIVKEGYMVLAVVTAPDKPAGRGRKLSSSPVKRYAEERDIRCLQPEKLREEHFVETLKALAADLFVVVAFRMLPKVVWEIPTLGTFNLHASLLPQYRGAAPINWAIINGEKETGVTTFFLNEHIDEGAILLRACMPIGENEDAGSLHDRLMQLGCSLVLKTIEAIANKQIETKEQQAMRGEELRLAPKIFKEDMLISWKKEGLTIVRLIQGLSPYPAAYTVFVKPSGDTVEMKIYKAEYESSQMSEEGKVFTDGKSYLKIGVVDGFVNLLDIQVAGKTRMKIGDFLRGNRDIAGWSLFREELSILPSD